MKKTQLTAHINKEVKDRFTQDCKERGLKISEAVEALIRLYLSGKIRIRSEITATFEDGEESHEGNH